MRVNATIQVDDLTVTCEIEFDETSQFLGKGTPQTQIELMRTIVMDGACQMAASANQATVTEIGAGAFRRSAGVSAGPA